MRKCLSAILLLLILFPEMSRGQKEQFIPGDESFSLTLAFHRCDTVTVVIPDSYKLTSADRNDIENYVFWGQHQAKPVYIYKKEADLKPSDFSKHIQLYGPFAAFHTPLLLRVPVQQTEAGFRIGNELFEQPDDAFFYLSSDSCRLYTCRNSTAIPNHYVRFGAGNYQLFVFRGNELWLTGFCPDDTFNQGQVNEMNRLRAKYFTNLKTRYFGFSIAGELAVDSLLNLLTEGTDAFLDTLCRGLDCEEEDLPGIKTCIYACMEDLQHFLGLPTWMSTYGKSVGTVNHISNFDVGVFRHETAHTVIEYMVGSNPNSFFSEGFAVWTGYLFAGSGYKQDLRVAADACVFLEPEFLLGAGAQFYSVQWAYPLSGIFVSFLIEKTGLDEFKRCYAENGFADWFNRMEGGTDGLIAEFGRWIGQQDTGRE